MSEQSDAVVLVVSEETGAISIAYEGQLYYDLSLIEVQQKLRMLIDRAARTTEGEGNEMQDIESHAAATKAGARAREEVFVE
jgi:diadenylate cyclase